MRSGILLSILTGFLQLTASCSKPNIKQSVAQPVDTTATPITVLPVDTSKTYLALGDSYTIGQSIPADQNYPNQTVALLNNSGLDFHAAEIIATTGWTTADLLTAIANKPVPTRPYDIVTLLIGVNNQYQGGSQAIYKTGFTTLLQHSIAYAGNRASHVIVVSIPDYSVTPYGKSTNNTAYISADIDSFNLINKEVSDSFNVSYLNVTDESRKALNDPSLIASDGLHFSAKEYAIWSSMLSQMISGIVQ